MSDQQFGYQRSASDWARLEAYHASAAMDDGAFACWTRSLGRVKSVKVSKNRHQKMSAAGQSQRNTLRPSLSQTRLPARTIGRTHH
jgi:hypothetical protein